MIAYHTHDDHVELGPDYIRLKNRYEIPNGQHETNEQALQMRMMSYCM